MKNDEKFVDKLEHVVKRNYANPNFNVNTMAAEMQISDRQLQRTVKAVIGQTPMQYLRNFRLECSLQLLRDGFPVGAAAKAVGFSSHAYFTACFRARFGITPQRLQDEPVRMTGVGDRASKRRNESRPY